MKDSSKPVSASIEDYIKTIYSLESDGQAASTKRIAQRLKVKMASVTGMIKHLASEGLVKHKPYYGVRLTDRGRQLAVRTIRRHRLLELFLVKTLGMTWDQVDEDAEVLEHAVSDRLIERIYEHLGRPEFDPHGSPIPDETGAMPSQEGVSLDQYPAGQRGAVLRVSDRDSEFLRYLTTLGLKIGSRFRLTANDSMGGLVTLKLGSRA